MSEWASLLIAFPTVLYVALSAVSLLYWGLVIAGAADLDALDAVAGKAEGAAHGAIDAIAGAAKGGSHALGEVLGALGLTKVPVTISLTIFAFAGLFLSLSTAHLLAPVLPAFLTAIAALVVSVVGAGALTSLGVRPLRSVFADSSTKKTGGRALLGRTVVITIDADDRSGQARTNDEGIVTVRCVPGQILARGEEAVLMDIGDDGVFIVEASRIVMPSTADAFAALAARSPDQKTVTATIDQPTTVTTTKS